MDRPMNERPLSERTMIELAADSLALSPLLETSRESDPKRMLESLGLFKNLNSAVTASLVETPPPPAPTSPYSLPKTRTQAASTPSYRPVNPLHEALRARAAARAAALPSSRVIKSKPLP